MGVKQRLEYGIFPIASRRHQQRDNQWGSFQKFDHQYTREESLIVIWSWILTIPASIILAGFTGRSLFECFVWIIIFDIMVWWVMGHD